MYEAFYGMQHTPFGKDIPAQRLYESKQVQDARGRLLYAADRKQFAVVTGDPGCGKSTLIRLLDASVPKEKYTLLYVSDSQLTPRWLYSGLLEQLGIKAHFYRGDAKRQLQRALKALKEEQKKDTICVLDEAHLLEKETLEEFRFLLNSEFDSASPLSLVLVGQTELWEKLRMQRYTAITQRIDMNIVLKPMDRSETGLYIRSHLAYAEERRKGARPWKCWKREESARLTSVSWRAPKEIPITTARRRASKILPCIMACALTELWMQRR